MALVFAADGDLVVHNHSALGTILDGTFFQLVYLTDDTARQSFGGKAGTGNDWGIAWRADLANDPFQATRQRATTYISANANAASFAAYGLNRWLFLCFCWNTTGGNSDQKLYMGSLTHPLAEPSAYVTQTVGSGTANVANADIRLGNGEITTREMHGRIAFSAVWPRPLDRREIRDVQEMFLSSSKRQDPRIVPGSVLWTYPGLTDANTPQLDYSGYGAHGTVTGATRVEDTQRLIKPWGFSTRKLLFIPPSVVSLVIQNASHAHTSENLTLTQVHALSVQNASHAHSAENLILTTSGDAVVLSPSANITASGENTTTQLAPPAGKSGSDFIAGRIQDDENPADSIDLGLNQYTEVEWAIELSTGASGSYEFRVTNNGTPLDAYTLTPELSVADAASLIIQSSSHSHTAENLTLTQVHVLAVQDASHAHTVQNIALTQVHELVIANSAHSHTAQNLTLTQAHNLTIQNASHSHTAENVVLTGAGDLVVQNASHSHTVDSLVLTQVHELAIQNSSHAHTAENVAITASSDLAVQSATHSHTAGSLVLTQVHSLAVQNASHGHAVENVVLGGEGTLAVQNSSHAHSVQSLTLTQVHELGTANATHDHSADSLTLTQVHSLTIQGASHGHTAENLVLAAEGTLGIQNGVHGHTAQNLTLTQVHSLVIASATHGHTAQSPTLVEVYNLNVQSALHSQTAENLTLTQVHNLIVSSSVHGHTVPSLGLGTENDLLIDNSVHGHTARNISFAFLLPVDIYTVEGANIFIVSGERILTVTDEDRIYQR